MQCQCEVRFVENCDIPEHYVKRKFHIRDFRSFVRFWVL